MSDRSRPRSVLTQLLTAARTRVTVGGMRLAGDVGGLGSLVAAAWLWHAGLAALGIALLVLAARGDRG